MPTLQKSHYSIASALFAVALLIIIAIIVAKMPALSDARGEKAAREVVTSFGLQLKNVALSGTKDVASSTMKASYGTLVTPEMLQYWQKNPRLAPGQHASSPSPERIEIRTVSKQGSGYIISGDIIQTTSAGPTDPIAVIIQVVRIDDTWLIGAYQEQVAGKKK